MTMDTLEINLDELDLQDLEVFFAEGSKGMPAFAASSGTNCNVACACSCNCPVKKQTN